MVEKTFVFIYILNPKRDDEKQREEEYREFKRFHRTTLGKARQKKRKEKKKSRV